jgi:chromosomal replication initiation ATPase DnaA
MTVKERRAAQIRHRVIKITYMALPGLKGDYDFPEARHNKPDYIEKLVCDYYGVPVHVLKSADRTMRTVQKRQTVMYLLRGFTNLTVSEIGERFNKDRTIATKAIKLVRDRVCTEPEYKAEMEFFEGCLK